MSWEETKEDVGYFNPHFPVVREGKATSKVHPVMDATNNGGRKSLNDAVHIGPKVINDLSTVLMHFREFPVVVCADIREMYLQIELRPEDKPYHKILWRTTDGRLRTLQFHRHVFGNAGSPFVAVYTIRKMAEESK